MSDALRLDQVFVTLGETPILNGVTLAVPRGRIVSIVGANGAGKTTLLDVVSGVVRETRGTVAIGDTNGTSNGHRAGIGRVFQGSPMPETLTVAEVASLATGDRPGAEALLSRFGLAPHATSFVAELSTGMRRILDLAIATVGQPGILLLDEPASGLAQSEIDHLADVVRGWRDETGSAVLLVEHDASLVRALADEVVVMEAGEIIARGSIDDVLAVSNARTRPRIATAHDERFHDALARVEAGAAPQAGLPKRTLSKWTLLRLGLREMSAGLASVMIITVLSRVLNVDRHIALGIVTPLLATYNLAAPIAIGVGHWSDTRAIMGRRRVPYVIAGSAITALAVAAAPHVAGGLSSGVSFGSVLFTVLLFVAMGVGMAGSGSAFLALLTDLSGPSDRGHAASVVYLELMVGVLLGVSLTGAVTRNGSNLGALFGLTGLAVFALSVCAVWGQEKHLAPAPVVPAHERVSLRRSLSEIAAVRTTRSFFVFMVLSMLFMFLQEAILTSFGGKVFHLTLDGSSGLQAMVTIGIIVGMVIAGRPYAEQFGQRRIAMIGLVGLVGSFAALAWASVAAAQPPVWLVLPVFGVAQGLFTVATFALMMGLSDRKRTALFMGAWTVARALAVGTAHATSGGIYELARRLFGSVPSGYAAVFAVEALGLALCIPLLRSVYRAQGSAEGAARAPLDAGAFALAPEGALLAVEADERALPVPSAPPAPRTPAPRKPAPRKPAPRKPAAGRRVP